MNVLVIIESVPPASRAPEFLYVLATLRLVDGLDFVFVIGQIFS